jgi:hypothetical protein
MLWVSKAKGMLWLSVSAMSACGAATVAEAQADFPLPGSPEFPLVQGSKLVDCPESVSPVPGARAVCVGMPNNDAGRATIDTYKTLLNDRGFEFAQYLGTPSVVVLKKDDGRACEFMIFGLPYLPPEERTDLLLAFQHFGSKPDGCEMDFAIGAPQ